MKLWKLPNSAFLVVGLVMAAAVLVWSEQAPKRFLTASSTTWCGNGLWDTIINEECDASSYWSPGCPPGQMCVNCHCGNSSSSSRISSSAPGITSSRPSCMNGTETIGLFWPSKNIFFLKNNNTTGYADWTFVYGPSGQTLYPVAGDWNNDRKKTVGLFDATNGTFYYTDSFSGTSLSYTKVLPSTFRNSYLRPIAGDWDGDGDDGLGIYDPYTGIFSIFKSDVSALSSTSTFDTTGITGIPGLPTGLYGKIGVAGDWDRDGKDNVGIFLNATSTFYLLNTPVNQYVRGPASKTVGFGEAGVRGNYAVPYIGNWKGGAGDGIGIFYTDNGNAILKDSLESGYFDTSFSYGPVPSPLGPNDPPLMPIAGDWCYEAASSSSSSVGTLSTRRCTDSDPGSNPQIRGVCSVDDCYGGSCTSYQVPDECLNTPGSNRTVIEYWCKNPLPAPGVNIVEGAATGCPANMGCLNGRCDPSVPSHYVQLTAGFDARSGDNYGGVRYVFNPPFPNNANLPYWGAMMKFPVIIENRGQDTMWESDIFSVTVNPQFPGFPPPGSFVFDHVASGTGCLAGTRDCFPVESISARCTVNGTQVTCPVPLMAPEEYRTIDIYYKTTKPGYCEAVTGTDGTGFRTDLMLQDGPAYKGGYVTYVQTPLQCAGCGDNFLAPYAGEECDDGNEEDGDGCSSTCELESGWQCDASGKNCWNCGNGTVDWGGQVCESKPHPYDSSYIQVCTPQGESCDDRNIISGDGCNAICQTEYCGDGIVNNNGNQSVRENCDEGKHCPGDVVWPADQSRWADVLWRCFYDQGSCPERISNSPGKVCTKDYDCGAIPLPGDPYPNYHPLMKCMWRNVTTCPTNCWLSGQSSTSSSSSSSYYSPPSSSSSRSSSSSSPTPLCGDGIRAGTEACDDANFVNGDGCSAICQVESGYACLGTPSVCTAICGDGIILLPEQCDDRNIISGDGCTSNCRVESGYACSGAPSVCSRICGNGILNAGEQCDDGNGLPGDGCTSCMKERGWDCAGQPSQCQTVCGDLILAGTEQCDDGKPSLNNDGCSATCRTEEGWTCDINRAPVCKPICGDGYTLGSEQCDDRNGREGDGCSSLCMIEPGYACTSTPSVCARTCGNGRIDAGEQCDDRNSQGGDGCSAFCSAESGYACEGTPSICRPTCGNGTLDTGEECDDRNNADNDGCDSSCHLETGWNCPNPSQACKTICGDGLLSGREQCDDGDISPGDGCSATCRLETGYSCTTDVPSVCAPTCGDGFVTAPLEKCDDRNILPLDGCSTVCTTERGWLCSGSPSLCTPLCGDGIKVGDEQCDDGNLIDHDGCNHLCKIDSIIVSSSSTPVSSVSSSLSSTTIAALPLCGNGRLEGSEECEQGVVACSPGFTCDRSLCRCAPIPAPSSRASSTPVTPTFSCGDRSLDPGEECESGIPCPGNASCTVSCRCMERASSSETWHPAASSSSESSFTFISFSSSPSFLSSQSSFSSGPLCGNGVLEDGELCDRNYPCPEGMVCGLDCLCSMFIAQNSSSAFSSSPISLCGNGLTEGYEQCDDGNITIGDGCSNYCSFESGYVCFGEPSSCLSVCGDSILTKSEQCDDGNLASGDGCSITCAIESGYTCEGEPSVCFPVCGNGIVEGNEQCDDGNPINGDGCSITCTIEHGAASSALTPFSVCGNGIVESDEQCDDGDTESGDGCSATCYLERRVSSSSSVSSSSTSASSASSESSPLLSSSSVSSSIPMPGTETPTRSPWALYALLALIVFVVGFAIAFFLKKLNAVKGSEYQMNIQ